MLVLRWLENLNGLVKTVLKQANAMWQNDFVRTHTIKFDLHQQVFHSGALRIASAQT